MVRSCNTLLNRVCTIPRAHQVAHNHITQLLPPCGNPTLSQVNPSVDLSAQSARAYHDGASEPNGGDRSAPSGIPCPDRMLQSVNIYCEKNSGIRWANIAPPTYDGAKARITPMLWIFPSVIYF
uniref:Uncharacterized protein n=1 Tax=Anopheles atroparvus TaxID=41427 RepID=A0AAG5D8P4_ANOAO